MDFELQSLHLSQAATLEADALVLLWPDAADPAKTEMRPTPQPTARRARWLQTTP